MNSWKNTVKKIASLGVGTAMVGATLMGAFAMDLADYPSQFIADGQFDGKIVVGAKAASQDIIGAIDIAASLQAASTTEVAISSGTTSTIVEGDAVKIGESSDLLEVGEYIGSVRESLDENDLLMLASGHVTTSKGTTKFTQTLELDPDSTNNNGRVILDQNKDDVEGLFLFFKSGQDMFNYELEFTSGLESDIDSNVAEDLEDESIFMLGQYYSIVDSSTASGLVLELIAGDVVDTMTEGQTRTYTVDGKDYEVTVLVIGESGTTDQVKFLVNGEVTDSLTEGDTDTLSDGLEIGVREIIETTAYRENDPGSVVEFYLGANKIEFDVSASGSAGDVEINRENIEDADVTITYTNANSVLRINSIDYALDADAARGNDVYIGEGEGLRAQLDEPEGLLNAEWDILFEGLTEPEMNEIRFDPGGDDEYEFEFTNTRGNVFAVPYAFAEAANDMKFGDEDDDFWFWEGYGEVAGGVDDSAVFLIGEDDYFLVTHNDDQNDGKSWVLQFDDVDTDDEVISFTLVSSGETVEATYTTIYSGAADSIQNQTLFGNPSGDIQLGGNDYSFWLRNISGTYTVAVDANNDDDLAGNDAASAKSNTTEVVNVVVKGGGILALAAAGDANPAGGDWVAQLTTLDEDVDSDVQQAVNITFTTDASTELDLSLPSSVGGGSGTWWYESVTDLDEAWAINAYGTWFTSTDEDSEADSLVIEYPLEQKEALVYVAGGDVQTSESTTGGNTYKKVNTLPVGLAVLDTEISMDDDNLIVVGGPCANSVAADLLGNPADCTEGFSAGMGMIKIFDTGDNVAVLVAGFSAEDTVQSSQILAEAATGAVDGLEGESVEVVIAGANDVTVRAAMEEVMEEVEEEVEEEAEE